MLSISSASVEDDETNGTQVDCPVVDEVDQTTRRGYNDLRTALHLCGSAR